MGSFKNLRIVDNFYQTSAFFPMPTILVGTLSKDGSTSLGPYSLVQPYYVAGREGANLFSMPRRAGTSF